MSCQVKTKVDLTSHFEKAGDKLVVVEFYGAKCPACKMIARTLEKLANKFAEKAVVLKIEASECLDLASEYEITHMPTFYFFKNTAKLGKYCGANTKKLTNTFIRFA